MICENCGKEHNGSYGSGRFCCKECARSFSTKNESHTLKEAKCIDCGKQIYINKRASIKTCKCNECSTKIKYCKFCGQIKDKFHDHSICKKHQIFHSLEKFGFNKDVVGTIYLFDEYNRIREIIETWYLINSSNEFLLKQDFNYTSGSANFHKLLKSLDIQSFNHSQAIRKAIEEGKLIIPVDNVHFKTEWHITWNNKEVFLRSSYESDYAKDLDEQKVDYEVETLRIKYFDTQQNEYRCAIPDFYIPSENMIVEIKSSWTLDEQNMKDKMKAYKELGYKFKLICDHKELELK